MVRWRTLPINDHILPFLGVGQIHINHNTLLGFVFPKNEGITLAEQARHLVEQSTSEDEVVQSVLQWVLGDRLLVIDLVD